MNLSRQQVNALLTAWLWFAIARVVGFAGWWFYAEVIAKVDEPPLILGLSFWTAIESALAVIVATIVARRQERS